MASFPMYSRPAFAGLLLLASTAGAQEPSTMAPDPDVGLPLWAEIYEVFSHPRCANCHVDDDHPRWSGLHYGATRVHGMNVRRGTDGSGFGNVGLRCTACHGSENTPVLHGPPGAENWHLAPAEMAWWEKSSRQVCEQIKDPERNGGRTLAEVAEHVRDDPLVRWGWEPGGGREPAPGSPEETYSKLVAWAQVGAPCPEN